MSLRTSLFSMLLISSAFVATACGPQTQPEAGEPAPTTESAPAGLETAGKCDKPSRHYISTDPGECLTLNWVCPTGQRQFFDDCGCGCE